MENKEELIKVLERHIVPGVRMEGKEVPDGQTKLKSASGDELSTDRDNFVKVKFCLRTRVECYNLKGWTRMDTTINNTDIMVFLKADESF